MQIDTFDEILQLLPMDLIPIYNNAIDKFLANTGDPISIGLRQMEGKIESELLVRVFRSFGLYYSKPN